LNAVGNVESENIALKEEIQALKEQLKETQQLRQLAAMLQESHK